MDHQTEPFNYSTAETLLLSPDSTQRHQGYQALQQHSELLSPYMAYMMTSAGISFNEKENAALYLYLGRLRQHFDSQRFPTSHLMADDPQQALSALYNDLGSELIGWTQETRERYYSILGLLAGYIKVDPVVWNPVYQGPLGIAPALPEAEWKQAYISLAEEWLKAMRDGYTEHNGQT